MPDEAGRERFQVIGGEGAGSGWRSYVGEYVLVFSSGGRRFAIDVSAVEDIAQRTEATNSPRGDQYVIRTSHGGERAAPLREFAALIGAQAIDAAEGGRILLLTHEGEMGAYIVDGFSGVIPADSDRFSAAMAPNATEPPFIIGMIRLDDEPVALIDPALLLPALGGSEQRVA